ncbi:uncharacterized protein PFLUO_LOCUS4978 [Penicillium psychrofluorescens]|uniref:uncharacterized protein n=1 Tax=Penicillium psychrofluorescens TaxID=3158075 RepID=UPI003CCD2B13
MALRLRQKNNITSVIYELRSEPTTLGGAIGIQSNGLRLLHRLGVYDDLAARGYDSDEIIIRSMQGSILGTPNPFGWAREQTGFGFMRIKRTDLVEVLVAAVRKAGIPIHWGKSLASITEKDESVTATFDDGTVDTADFLFGCDGIHSAVRSLYVDPEQVPEYSGFAGLFSVVPNKSDVAGMNATLTQEGMFAAMPCRPDRNELFWVFVKEVALPKSTAVGDERNGWEVHGKVEVEGFKESMLQVLKDARGDWGDRIREIVRSTSVVKFLPIYRLPLGKSWARGRVQLIGDSAHAMQPHAGQGTSMALEDVFLLARLLEDSGRPVDEAYARFEQIRRPRVDKIYALAARNAEERKKASPWGLWCKEMALWMFMLVSWAVGLDRRGMGQKHMAYDIDEEVL